MMNEGCAVLIGGGGGIGRSLVERLRSRNTPVVVASRDQTHHHELDVDSVSCDARDFSAVEQVLVQATERHGGVTQLVCLAGSILLKPAHMTNAEEWQETIATNLTTAFACVRAAGKTMSSGGSVVLVSTVAAGTGLSNHEAIAAAKGGIEGLVRSAAATYAGRNLRFNAVAPGLVDTPLATRITKSERALEHSKKMHPLGSIGTPEDVSSAIDWLLSNESGWVTGQVVGIVGGLGAIRS